MAGFLYYLPGFDELPAGALAEVGLADRLGQASLLNRVSAGPDGGSGLLVRAEPAVKPSRKQPLPAYRPQAQEWQQAGAYWLGWERERPPGPDDLQRRPTSVGLFFPRPAYEVELADGRKWLVRVVRSYLGEWFLDKVYTRGPNGQRVSEVVPRYRGLQKRVERLWQEWLRINGFRPAEAQTTRPEGGPGAPAEETEGAPGTFTDDDLFELACDGLGLTYRVSSIEVLALGLLTTHNLRPVLMALLDEPRLLAEALVQERVAEEERV